MNTNVTATEEQMQGAIDQFLGAGKSGADLVVRAFGSDGLELATSPVLFNAGQEETLDLVVGGEVYRGPSEYQQLVTQLTPLLHGLTLGELSEDDEHQDVTFLSGETGQDIQLITLLVAAHRLLKETEVPAEAFYGMFRQGLPTNLPVLLAQSRDVQRRALVRSAAANIIPPSFGAEADAIVERLKVLVVAQALKQSSDSGGPATLSDLLGVALADTGLRQDFLGAYADHTGPMEEFWGNLAARPEFKDRVADAQRTLQLGALTGNHLPLVRELQRIQLKGEITSLADLACFDVEGWLSVISRTGDGGVIGT